MKHEVYLDTNLNYKTLIFSVFFLFLLMSSVYLKSSHESILIDIFMYVVIVFNALWFLTIYSFYKARLEVDSFGLHAPFYIWYEHFKFEENEVPFVKTLQWDEIEKIEHEKTYHAEQDVKRDFIKVSVKEKYILCIVLENYNDEKLSELLKVIENYKI